MTEDEMVGRHHQFNGHEFEPTPGDSEGQGSLVCCSSRGRKEWDTTSRLSNREQVEGHTTKGLWVEVLTATSQEAPTALSHHLPTSKHKQ